MVLPKSQLNAVESLYCHGVTDPAFHAFLKRVLSGSDVYIDVGSHIGQSVLQAGLCLSSYGRVIAVEPNPEIRNSLRRNILMWRNLGLACEVEVCSLEDGEEVSRSMLGAFDHIDAQPGESVPLEATVEGHRTENEHGAVPLDDIVKDISHIRLLKIDVGQRGLATFLGGHRTLFSGRIDFVVIASQSSFSECRHGEILTLLEQLQTYDTEAFTLGPFGRMRAGGWEALNADHDFAVDHIVLDLRRLRHKRIIQQG